MLTLWADDLEPWQQSMVCPGRCWWKKWVFHWAEAYAWSYNHRVLRCLWCLWSLLPWTVRAFAKLSQPQLNHFHALGILTQPSIEKYSAPIKPPTYPVYNTGSHLISRYRSGTFESRALLRDVRRITVSSGADGKSRPSHCVSGLRFDYTGNKPSAIVGQWISSGNCFDMIPGEAIVGLVFWLSKDMEHPNYRGETVGRVLDVQLETSFSRVKEFFGVPMATKHSKLRFCSNGLERLVCLLYTYSIHWFWSLK